MYLWYNKLNGCSQLQLQLTFAHFSPKKPAAQKHCFFGLDTAYVSTHFPPLEQSPSASHSSVGKSDSNY